MSIYNESEKQIREAIISILNQTFADFELIIIGDNPNRCDLKSIIDNFDDKRIRLYINENNIGLAMCMNKAASLAKSNYYFRMDADDVALPNRFEKEIDILLSGKYDFCYSSYNTINSRSEIIKEAIPESDVMDSDFLHKQIQYGPNIIHHPTVAFTKNIFEKTNGYRNFPCSQDSDLWLRMAEVGCRFYQIGTPLLNYRINENSITNKRWYQQQITCHYIFELSLQRIIKGKDNFSTDNYEKYLRRWKIGKQEEEKKLRTAMNLLQKAESFPIFKKLFFRTYVFVISPVQRRHFIALIIKKILLLLFKSSSIQTIPNQ